jgi:hypothetical protein
MELNTQTQNTNGNGHLVETRKSQSIKTGSLNEVHHSTFDPMKYMLKLPKSKKLTLPNGQERWEQIEADYLPVAARIAWFRRDHPMWGIITEVEQLADKAVVMKATIKNSFGDIIATARKKETQIGFPDYIEKAESASC